jgi:hypothetical protein
LLGSLFDAAQQQQICDCLRNAAVITFIIDNFQKGQHLKNQRGERSSTFLSGTKQLAEESFLYTNAEFDDIMASDGLSYTLDECYVSPDGMPSYEAMDEYDLSTFFVNHKEMSQSPPDFTGVRVKKYAELVQIASNLKDIQTIFVEERSLSSSQTISIIPISVTSDRTAIPVTPRAFSSTRNHSRSKLFVNGIHTRIR